MSSRLIILPKLLARLLDTAFLGSSAIKATAKISGLEEEPQDIIIDTGSDITLISSKCLNGLRDPPKSRGGQKVTLIQVTGSARIDGFVDLPLIFDTPQGPVQLNVEAYVVKGMSTPFILGNNFQVQFGVSILRSEGCTELLFGNSGVHVPVQTTGFEGLTDDDGHAFALRRQASASPRSFRKPTRPLRDRYVRTSDITLIPPQTSKLV